jgi:branched-chain amino acid transport system ATP-binding protein
MQSTAAVLEVAGVSGGYGGAFVVHDISLTVGRGQLIAIVGENGSGKTTLLDLISGFRRPSQGSMRFLGTDLNAVPPFQRSRLGIARVFQSQYIFPNLTIGEHMRLAVASRPHAHRNSEESSPGVQHFLDATVLGGREGALAGTLSFGQAKVLGIVCALVRKPILLLLDEPMAGLDEGTRAKVNSWLEMHALGGGAAIVAEHNAATLGKDFDQQYHLGSGTLAGPRASPVPGRPEDS